MATLTFPSEPTMSLSASMSRYTTAAAPSMADSLPALAFNFEDLRSTMNNFTRHFDAFIASSRAAVLSERQSFRTQLAAAAEQTRQTQHSVTQLESKASAHQDAVASHVAETQEMQDAVRELALQRDAHKGTVEELRSKLGKVKSEIATRRAAQKHHQQYIAHQASFNAPEIDGWEERLGLKIEGTGRDDVVRFVFVGCDAEKAAREAWFELDMRGETGRPFEIGACKPKLDQREMGKAVTLMCEDELLGPFLKNMRGLFVTAMN